MKKYLIPVAIGALLASAAAFAGPGGTTCGTAEQIFPGTVYNGDTSASGYANNTNSFGAIPSPANDAYYYFVSDGQATTSIAMTPSYNAGMVLVSSCSNNPGAPIEANGGNSAFTMTIDNGSGGALTNGTTYYVIVTGNPTGNSSDNGAFTFTTPTPLPVKLQKFSVK